VNITDLTTSIKSRRAQIERFRTRTSHDYTQGYLDALDDIAVDLGLIPPAERNYMKAMPKN
jgi:hypothetical protein